jgi:hypothetical protein
MTDPTPSEVRSAVLADLETGTAEIQIGDRRERKLDPSARLKALSDIEGSTKSPFIKVGLKARSF